VRPNPEPPPPEHLKGDEVKHTPHRLTAARFLRAVRMFMTSEAGGQAKLLLAGLVILLCGVNGLNVVNSYVGSHFMTAIAHRDTAGFMRQAVLYVGVFSALTVVSVIARYAEELLGLIWRNFLTRRAVTQYLADGAYFRLDAAGKLTHPDQRIAEDIRAFTVTTLSFVIMALGSCLTIIAFSGVLWMISPLLFIVAVLYAAIGSFLTIALGRPLITLNYDRLDKEATFRSGLIHIRENAESILTTRSEKRQSARLLRQLDDVVANFRTIVSINRNVGFFTTGYNWLIQIIPALIVAPAFISGRIEFGVITQSSMAFAAVVAAFSLIVTQFQSISTFAAVVARLSSLVEAIEEAHAGDDKETAIEVVERDGPLAYEQLTLTSPNSETSLIQDMSLSVAYGSRVLLKGKNQDGGAALFRATAGVWADGAGRVIRPKEGDMRFLPQKPYLPPATLRQVLLPSDKAGDISDDSIVALLGEFNLQHIAGWTGGLDAEEEWGARLSLRDQQVLSLIRVMLAAPRFVFMDRIETAIGPEQIPRVLKMLQDRSIAYIHHAEEDGSTELYDAFLEYREDGAWTWTARQE
jgi:vitamin B12/bleomycin/antimicrobial peptide transport system ATP-binding/permease protein